MTGGVAGSTKKFAFGAVYQLGYAVGNIIGPQTFRANDAPNYYASSTLTISPHLLTDVAGCKVHHAGISCLHSCIDCSDGADPHDVEFKAKRKECYRCRRFAIYLSQIFLEKH